ncbi:unnamed protein product [Polarella glacialis]|uniref:Uncharacterized protein n=1 Tax=Polarella glacialis TaxID=89957 RepID=A0A813F3L1_POLGL|nr:unnamed protein product [Polarella glacialis]
MLSAVELLALFCRRAGMPSGFALLEGLASFPCRVCLCTVTGKPITSICFRRYEYFWLLGLVAFSHFCTGFAMMEEHVPRAAGLMPPNAPMSFHRAPWSKRLALVRPGRCVHHLLALFLGVPLLITIITGVAYRLLRMHGYKDEVKWLRVLHSGYFSFAQPFFPISMCLVVIGLSSTGFFMGPIPGSLRKLLHQFSTSGSSKNL